MHDEADFLRALSENPADDALRMIYADWLDELSDDESKRKAHFLRVTGRLMGPIQRVGWRHARRKELHELARSLPGAWLAVVSRLQIENCEQAATREGLAREGFVFNVVCDKRWDELAATDAPTVRHCDACDRSVHYCDTIVEARRHARQGHCVAVDLGIIRRDNDLAPPRGRMRMGRMLPAQFEKVRRRELERDIDEVSREREERKRQNASGENA